MAPRTEWLFYYAAPCAKKFEKKKNNILGVFTKCKYLYSPGFYTANEFTTVLTIQALLASEDGITVDVGTSDGADNSLNLNVQGKISFATKQQIVFTYIHNANICH